MLERSNCVGCHHWVPLASMPQVGECGNPASSNFKRSIFGDRATENCFLARSLEGLEFVWCQTHRQTIYSAELRDHKYCRLFMGTVNLPVEEQAELTLAGD
jgi:hypothetical protein